MKRNILLFFCLLLIMTGCSPKIGTFEIGENTFLLNGEPYVIKAAEIHYPRIPKEYWEHRIQMSKALGMNTVCLYIFWNYHEPEEGQYDFTGQKDIAAFCRLAQKHGLNVIVRPGPYVCAEWEMGGLPWWLLKKKDIKLRESDPYYMERTRLFMHEVGKQLADQQITRGGNIIMVQVENEYGAFGVDKPYIAEIRDIVKESGFTDVPLFQCDWNSNFENNALDDLVWTINFGTGANIDQQFERLKELRPTTPLMCSEFWSGWFDHWGAQHETRSAEALVNGMKEMLDKNISFSLYMTHGGTSFGHWAGANFPNFSPTCTSYDYDAPINESGNVTPKFYEVRQLLERYLPKGEKLSKIPDSIPTIAIPEFELTEVAPLFDNLPEAKLSEKIQSMECFDQGWGSILYRTTLKACDKPQSLIITEAHDWTQVFLDGEKIATLSRMKGEGMVNLPAVKE
ncbi:beta-galactosidase, partial [Parabacteroides sp. OttesenSCG-928-J18]|nr:beta-galactosidase [Parabacteroides sp. OttesenSCG-928-J18]